MYATDRQRPKSPIVDFWPFLVWLLSRMSLGFGVWGGPLLKDKGQRLAGLQLGFAGSLGPACVPLGL